MNGGDIYAQGLLHSLFKSPPPTAMCQLAQSKDYHIIITYHYQYSCEKEWQESWRGIMEL
jgi:hypothetical protein